MNNSWAALSRSGTDSGGETRLLHAQLFGLEGRQGFDGVQVTCGQPQAHV